MVKDIQTSTDGIISDAMLLPNGCVYGTVVLDRKGRFNCGNWIRTSIVDEDTLFTDTIKTMNSTYTVENWVSIPTN